MQINNQNAMNYGKQLNHSLLSIAAPLMDNFPINVFCYTEYLSPQEYFYLCGNLSWSEVHLSMPSYGGFLEEQVKNSAQHEGFTVIVWSNLANDHFMKRAMEYQFMCGINFYQNIEGVVRSWSFTSSRPEGLIFFQENKNIFKHFIEYFNKTSESFITPLARQKACAQWEVPMNLEPQPFDEEKMARQRFFEATSLKNKKITCGGSSFELTPHQWRHLELYAKGHSMKEMAIMLNISPRTVEAILNTIRSRSGLSCKSALRQMYEKNNFLVTS